jgi:hypothetical protein
VDGRHRAGAEQIWDALTAIRRAYVPPAGIWVDVARIEAGLICDVDYARQRASLKRNLDAIELGLG